MTKLQELDLHGTPITDATLDQAQEGWTALKTLDLSNTKISDKGMANLKDLTNL